MHIIIIYMSEWVYMYIYQSSRVTVAVTKVFIGAHSCISLLFIWVSECTCISYQSIIVTVAVTGVFISAHSWISLLFTWVSECTCISTKAVVYLLWNWYIHACHYYLYDIYNSGVENNYVTLNLLQTIIDSEIVKRNFGFFGPKMGVKMRISKNPFHPSEMTP